MAITTSLGVISLVMGLFGYHAIGSGRPVCFGAAIWAITPLVCGEKPLGNGGNLRRVFLHAGAIPCTSGDATLPARKTGRHRPLTALMLAIRFQIPLCFHCTCRALRHYGAGEYLGDAYWPTWGALRFSAVGCCCSRPLKYWTPIYATETFSKYLDKFMRKIRESSQPADILRNISASLSRNCLIGHIRVLMPGWLGLGLIVADRSLRGRALRALAFLGGALFLWVAGISFFGAHDAYDHAIRFLFAWVSLSVMLSGWGYALLLRALGRALDPLCASSTNDRELYSAPFALLRCSYRALLSPSKTCALTFGKTRAISLRTIWISTVASGRYVISGKGPPS